MPISARPRYSKFKRPFNKKVKKNVITHSLVSSKIAYGSFGIKILETCKLQYYHIETMRRAIVRLCKFNSKIWFRLFFDTPLTSKPLEARMGKGKGKLKYYTCLVKRGSFILELDNLPT
jgi:large subunit ribosomal protein L16